jgi:hypothetical protein
MNAVYSAVAVVRESAVSTTAHRQAQLDTQTAISEQTFISASRAVVAGSYCLNLYRDTPTRAQWRNLIDAAVGLPGVVLVITYLKKDGDTRTIMAQPYEVDADFTKKYCTVWDVEEADYRRVNLDAILKLSMETHSAPCMCPRAHG